MTTSPQSPELLESFLLDAWDALSSFDTALQSLEDTSKLKSLSVVTHRLKGTAALYGFGQISKLCELIERFLSKSDRFSSSQLDSVHMLLQQVSVVLSSSLEQIASTGTEGQVGLQFSALGGSKLLGDLIKQHPELFIEARQSTQKQSRSTRQILQSFYRNHQEDWSFFAPEAEEMVEIIQLSLDDLKTQGINDASISSLFRATHTLKGAAYMVGLEVMGDLAHKLEDLMVRVRDRELELNREAMTCLEEGALVLGLMLDTAQGRATELEPELAKLETKLSRLLGLDTAPQKAGKSELILSLEAFFAQNQDVWEYFAPEVAEHVEVARLALENLIDNANDEEALQTLFRALHTIKGAAYMVELNVLGDLACDLETLSRHVQDGSLELEDSLIESFAKGLEVVEKVMALAAGQKNDGELQLSTVLESLAPYLPELKSRTKVKQDSRQETSPSPSKISTVRVSSDRLDTLMDLAGDVITLRSRMTEHLERLAELTQLMESSQERMLHTLSEFEKQYLNPQLHPQSILQPNLQSNPQSSSLNPKTKQGISGSLQDVFDELEFDTYNDLNILARSVAEMANDVSEIKHGLNQYYQVADDENERLQGISRQLRQEISRARMVPISQLYGLLKRLLRNTSEKAYLLETSGENVELDNAILESVSESMLHLVRNSLSHGIETREERLAKGKPAEGLIQLKAYHRGNHVYVEVQDDGAGIDVERVKEKALEKGFKTKAELATMSYEESCQLIFIAGLSTAKELSTDAGRGVGMDAVASSVKKLKGEISLETEPGKGTKFSLKLPLTLLISDALMVDIGGQTFGFASDSVETLQRLNPEECPVIEGKRFISYQNKALELFDLRRLLGFPAKPEAKELVVVITKAERQTLAYLVDEHLGLSEIVVRELNPALTKLSHLSNATLAPNGDIIMLLDPLGLTKLEQKAVQASSETGYKPASKALELLLVDDSVSVRRVISKMLERAGYQVTTAGDGQEALELIMRNRRFDAVLSDLEMPRMNGYELLEELRRRPDTKTTPIIIMTTRAGDKHRNLALELGANTYFSKPIDEIRLVTELRNLAKA